MTNNPLNYSVLILTLNEEVNIENCIKSIAQCDDIVILDSYSKDATEEIAKQNGARVYKREFDNYASQRNYGINDIEYKHKWLLMLDADEEVTQELLVEMYDVINNADENMAMFRFRRKDYYMGSWVKHSSGYPTWFGRLFKIGKVNVQRAINEEYHADGLIGDLKHHINHYPFNNGLSAWVEKHNRYSTMEAQHALDGEVEHCPLTYLFSMDPVKRRKLQKQIIYSLPFRPLVVFILFYVLRGGFLDGMAGLRISLLKSFYELLIVYKIDESKRVKSGKQK